MPFVVKATYRNEIRKFSFNDGHFPSYVELYQQLYRVFAIGHSYYLSRLLFSPQEGPKILIGLSACSAAEYDAYCAPFKGRIYPDGRLTFSVFDEAPRMVFAPRAGSVSSLHPIPPAAPTPSFAPPPPPVSPPLQLKIGVYGPSRVDPPHHNIEYDQPRAASIEPEPTMKRDTPPAPLPECCSVSQGKKEIKVMMDNFLRDFTRIMGNTFGEQHSFLDPLDTPTVQRTPIARSPQALPMIDIDSSLHIPGSFIQPRPQTPNSSEEDSEIEHSQTPPQLETLQTLHPGIWCDFCGKQIRGLRFKCQECPYYDLCANCIVVNQALDKHNENQVMIHRFHTISPPKESVVSANPSTRRRPATSSLPSDARPVHRNVECDLCDRIVVGKRHKCLDCIDYDLCDSCIETAPARHPGHRFMTLETPTRVYFQNFSPPQESAENHLHRGHSARCNLCDSRIIGERYKCTDCPDFDTCASCFAITSQQHPLHTFVRLNKSTDYLCRQKPVPVCHFATCDVCNRNIIGVRYKCMHPECPDFDLCQDCEALPIPVHPATHPLLKLRDGDTHIPWVQRKTSREDLPRPLPTSPPAVATPVPIPASASDSASTTTNKSTSRTLLSPTDRLHAFRAKAKRRLSARMQQLQNYPFSEDNVTPAVHPIIEERLVRERKEAEEKAKRIEHEIREIEEMRRLRHEYALGKSHQPYMESVKAAFSDHPEEFHNFIRLLISRFGATDSATAAPIAHRIRETLRLSGHPELVEGLDGFIEEVMNPPPSQPAPESQTTTSQPAPPSEAAVTPIEPEMAQKRTSLFGNPFLHPLDSPFQATFISENNIPDGHVFPAGAEFVKSWRLVNDGPEAWPVGTELVYVGGMRLGAFVDASMAYAVGIVSSGEEVDVYARDMKAPEIPGRYISHWRLRDPQGRHFGPRMWCDIAVIEADSDSSQGGSLAASAVVMPETALELTTGVNDGVNLPSSPSSPITVPSSAVSGDASSDTESFGSVSFDPEWDEIPDVPPPAQQLQESQQALSASVEVEYQVLYDSADDDA